MAKPYGPICNLDCKYCFFLEKEDLYGKKSFAMSEATLEIFVKQYIAGQPEHAEYKPRFLFKYLFKWKLW